MALDGIFTHFLVNELNEKLNKSRVEGIWSNQNAIYLQLYKQKVRYFLNINLNAAFASVYITNNPGPKNDASNFINHLKKHLEGAILESIEQYETDRVFIFNFVAYDFIVGPINKRLVFEAMGKHNNLFLLEGNKVIDSYKRTFVLEGRNIIPNSQFEFFTNDKENAKNYTLNPNLTYKEIADKYTGISTRLARFLEKNAIKPLEINVTPVYSIKDNKAYFFNIFEGDTISFESLSEALDTRVMKQSNPKTIYLNFVESAIAKLNKKTIALNEQYESSIKNLVNKDIADSIYASNLDLNKSYKKFNDVDLDERYSLSKNAQNFYKIYHKAKRSLSFIENELNLNKDQTETLENFIFEINNTVDTDLQDFKEILAPYGFLKQSLKKQNKPVKSKIKILTIKDSNATYYVGKNSLQNQYIMNELGKPNDYWFHVKNAPGSHLLVKTELLDEQVLRKAAMLSAYFSSLKESSSIPVNYTNFKYVSKISGKPASFVKLKNEKTIFIDIDKNIIETYLHKS